MQIGCLGAIPFKVSDDSVQTLTNFRWSGSVQIATHNRHLQNSLTEPTGRDPDQISFDIRLSAFLGVNLWDALLKIWDYERNFVTLPLVIGDKAYGKYRWLIQSHTVKGKYFDGKGNLIDCDVSVKLVEYLRGGEAT